MKKEDENIEWQGRFHKALTKGHSAYKSADMASSKKKSVAKKMKNYKGMSLSDPHFPSEEKAMRKANKNYK